MERKVLHTALAALTLALLAPLSMAHPVLSFDEQSVTQPAKDSGGKTIKRDSRIRVTLGHQYLSIDSPAGRDILDFKIRRTYHIDLKKKTYEASSLYALLGFALIESQNRLALNRMLDAAALTDDSRTPQMVSQLFSVSVRGGDVPLDTVKADGGTVYRWKTHDLLSVSDASRPLPADYQTEYWRWVRLYYGGHPSIYENLATRSGVPETLRILRPDVSQTTVTLKLKSVKDSTDNNTYSLEGFELALPKIEPYLTLHRLHDDALEGLNAQTEAAQRDRDAAAAAGKFFDAELAHLVLGIASGDGNSTWPKDNSTSLRADPQAREFASALTAKNEEGLKIGVKALAVLKDKTSSSYAYVLDVFAANHEAKMRHTAQAERLFLSALARNPYLTGAWFDLGKLYYATFRTREAWACWDTARRLNPEHPFRKDIDALERRMFIEQTELF